MPCSPLSVLPGHMGVGHTEPEACFLGLMGSDRWHNKYVKSDTVSCLISDIQYFYNVFNVIQGSRVRPIWTLFLYGATKNNQSRLRQKKVSL